MIGIEGPTLAAVRDAEPERAPGVAVAVFPDMSRYNPYQALLERALNDEGVKVVNPGGALSARWVLRERRRLDAVHLHWLELLAFDSKRRYALLLDTLRTARLWLGLQSLRASRMRVVWTVHNLKPHEVSRPRLYRLLERAAASVADDVITHSEYAADQVRGEVKPNGAVHVSYHGSYLGWYPTAEASRAELRDRHGLPEDAFVFLAFGQLRPYKRVADALRAFRGLEGDDLRFLVAGNPSSNAERAELEQCAADDPRVVLELRWIGDEEVDGWHRASDAVVLNYPEIFSSGALLLAWSLGRPVVAPAGGTVDELARYGPIEAFAGGRLADALAGARARWGGDADAAARDATSAAKHFTWDAMASELRGAYSGS
jgi:beta-1,4-mannosyltransferase